MTYNQILIGIHDSDTRGQLTDHLDDVDAAIDRDECSYDLDEWAHISDCVAGRMKEFDTRVLH